MLVQDYKYLANPNQNRRITNKCRAYLFPRNKDKTLIHLQNKRSELPFQKTRMSSAPAEELWTKSLNPEPSSCSEQMHPHFHAEPWPLGHAPCFTGRAGNTASCWRRKNAGLLWSSDIWVREIHCNLMNFYFSHFKDVYELLSECYYHL